jgi:hypothetical protein
MRAEIRHGELLGSGMRIPELRHSSLNRRAAFVAFPESKLGEPKPFMLRFELESSFLNRNLPPAKTTKGGPPRFPMQRTVSACFCLFAFFVCLPAALAQEFSFQATPFNPYAIDPGGTTLSTLTLTALNGFNGTVGLTCQVAPASSTAPGCAVSPAQVSPTATSTLTVTGTNPVSGLTASPGSYSVTVTATGPTTTVQQTPGITVLSVAPGFTITIGTGIVPSSVHAGSGGQATININPLNGYTSPSGQGQGVWMSCSSITPLVTLPPVCSFSPQPVNVNGVVTPVTLTINTTNTNITRTETRPRGFFGSWLALPILGLVGFGAVAGNQRSRKAWGVLALLVLGGALLLAPGCGNNNANGTVTTPNGLTPNNNYTFTIIGVDSGGIVSSNTSGTTAAPTVSLTVD